MDRHVGRRKVSEGRREVSQRQPSKGKGAGRSPKNRFLGWQGSALLVVCAGRLLLDSLHCMCTQLQPGCRLFGHAMLVHASRILCMRCPSPWARIQHLHPSAMESSWSPAWHFLCLSACMASCRRHAPLHEFWCWLTPACSRVKDQHGTLAACWTLRRCQRGTHQQALHLPGERSGGLSQDICAPGPWLSPLWPH